MKPQELIKKIEKVINANKKEIIAFSRLHPVNISSIDKSKNEMFIKQNELWQQAIDEIKKHIKKYKVEIIESEAGWGQKTDSVKEFDTEKEADDFVTTYNAPNNKPVTPGWYMYAVRIK